MFFYPHKRSGFTLLEILIAMAIMGGIISVIFILGLDIADFTNFFGQSLSSQEELQQTLKIMKSELRSLGPSSVGGYPIEIADNQSLVFFSDIDGDGLFERVHYYLEGAVFKKGVIKPTGNPLTYLPQNEKIREQVHFVVNGALPVFKFWSLGVQKDQASLTAPFDISKIRMIRTFLLVDEVKNQPPGPVSLEIWSTPRNLRFDQ